MGETSCPVIRFCTKYQGGGKKYRITCMFNYSKTVQRQFWNKYEEPGVFICI